VAEVPPVRCQFYVRSTVSTDPLAYRFEALSMESRSGRDALPTHYPPVVGDLIALTGQLYGDDDQPTAANGVFRVVERQWLPSNYGSRDWPSGEAQAIVGPMLFLAVEAAEGMFEEANRG
jgi:hypothetical protein